MNSGSQIVRQTDLGKNDLGYDGGLTFIGCTCSSCVAIIMKWYFKFVARISVEDVHNGANECL